MDTEKINQLITTIHRMVCTVNNMHGSRSYESISYVFGDLEVERLNSRTYGLSRITITHPDFIAERNSDLMLWDYQYGWHQPRDHDYEIMLIGDIESMENVITWLTLAS
jgi:hypothetical protein